MSAHVLANEGIQLVKNNKYAEGIEKLSQALRSQPAPMWLLERSKAYVRTNDFDLALHDAERALAIAFKRANRDLMVDAQLRRAIVLYRMNRCADADVCAFWAIQLVDGARASEDDGQQKKLDDKGDYIVTLQEVKDEDAKRNQAIKEEGLGAAMGAGRSKDTSNRNLASSWRIQALTQLEKLEPGAPGRKVTVVKYPTPSDEPPVKSKGQTERVVERDDSESEEESNKPKIPAHIVTGSSPSAPSVAPAPAKTDVSDWAGVWSLFRDVHTKNNSIRADFYQSDTSINISLFVKDTPQSEFKGSAQAQSVTLRPIRSSPSGYLILRLHDKIKAEDTTYNVKSMKIELVLKKATPGKWGTWKHKSSALFDDLAKDGLKHAGVGYHGEEAFAAHAKKLGITNPADISPSKFDGDLQAWYLFVCEKLSTKGVLDVTPLDSAADAVQSEPMSASKPAAEKHASKTAAPTYPTSAKGGPKNWDTLDLDDDEEKDDGVDDFFKKLYKDADPDTRRAMMKSYVESNGTSLSTSWAEASTKTYETSPPDGSEAKKWD